MTKTNFQNNAIFWVEVDKISPNPYQPRKEFTESGLRDLAESIRMYGILQPLTVTRREVQTPSGMSVEYELIAGERRLRASKLAGLVQVPVIIRSGPEDSRIKLELAIIENLQREDLNPIDRALAFKQLSEEFEFTHSQIAKKVGKSREYVSNSIRLLQLPEEIQQAISAGKISEGHARPLGMLRDKPSEQSNVFREVVLKKLTVRDTEKIARGIAKDKVRKNNNSIGADLERIQNELSQTLGTRVHIEPREIGGKLVIDYFSKSDVEHLLELVNSSLVGSASPVMNEFSQALEEVKSKEAKDADDVAPANLPTDSGRGEVAAVVEKESVKKEPLNPTIEAEKVDDNPFAYLNINNTETVDEKTKAAGTYSATNELLNSDSNDEAKAVEEKEKPEDTYGLGSFSV